MMGNKGRQLSFYIPWFYFIGFCSGLEHYRSRELTSSPLCGAGTREVWSILRSPDGPYGREDLLEDKKSKVYWPGPGCFSVLQQFGTFLLTVDAEEILPINKRLCKWEICPLQWGGRRLGL